MNPIIPELLETYNSRRPVHDQADIIFVAGVVYTTLTVSLKETFESIADSHPRDAILGTIEEKIKECKVSVVDTIFEDLNRAYETLCKDEDYEFDRIDIKKQVHEFIIDNKLRYVSFCRSNQYNVFIKKYLLENKIITVEEAAEIEID